jgi:signal transduction histidine kinase
VEERGTRSTQVRILAYLGTAGAILLWWLSVRDSSWRGNEQMHVLAESVSCTLALTCAAVALIRFFTRRRAEFLLIGAGFIGTGVLEIIHLVASSTLIDLHYASTLSEISPWTFFAARLFLAGALCLSLVASRAEMRGQRKPFTPAQAFIGTALFTLAVFVTIAQLNLPPAYYQDLFFSRPGELLPGGLFALALAGYLVRGRWRHDVFEHWLVLSLIAVTMGQVFFMAQSKTLYGPLFFSGHLIKVVGYIALLVGLFSNVYLVFREVGKRAAELRRSNEDLEKKTAALTRFGQTLQELQRITMTSYDSYDELFADYLNTGCDVLDLEIGIISQVQGSNYRLRAVRSNMGWQPGDEFDLDDVFCAEVITRETTVSIDKVSEHPKWSDHQTRIDTGLESYIGAPIYENREVTGTLCFSTTEMRPGGFDASERDLVTAMAQTVGRLLERERAEIERAELERMKDEFLSIVSHELRTPLTSIRGSLGLLAGGVLGELPERGQRMIEIASTNTDRLVRLINDILDIEKMQSGRLEMNREVLSAAEVVNDALELMQAMARDAGVVLAAATEDTSFFADRDRMQQTFSNLISNAVKFSEPGKEVHVSARREDDEVIFSVADSGRGIPEDKLDLVFERFQQVDSSDARDKGGTGLGLPICKEIVERHGGRIWLESALGRGTTFFFTIPDVPGAPRGETVT